MIDERVSLVQRSDGMKNEEEEVNVPGSVDEKKLVSVEVLRKSRGE